VLATTLQFAMQKAGAMQFRIFSAKGRRLDPGHAAYYVKGAAADSKG
jgi:hypothetical protein